MKKFIVLSLLIVVAGCAGNNIVVKEFDAAHVLPCNELRTLKNVTDMKEYAVYLDKGDTFPLMLTIDDDSIGVLQKSIDIALKKKLFFMVKMPEDPTQEELKRIEQFDWDFKSDSEQQRFMERYMLYVSVDARHWAPLYDGKALKSIMGIKSGRFSFGIGMNPEEGVRSALTVKTER